MRKTAAEQREREEKARLEAERREREEKERLEGERRQKEERDRLETERRHHEEKERLEQLPQSQLSSQVAPLTPSAQREADKPSAETPKVVHPLPPEPAESEREKPSPPSSGGIGRKRSSKQVIAFLAIATVLVVAGLIYLATRVSQSPPPQPASVAAVTPSPATIAAPTAEEQAPGQGAVSPLASSTPQPTTPSPTSFAAKSLAQAQRYLDTKDFAKALPLLQKAAEGGNAEAMYNLGELYYQGWGVARDYDKARAWYQAAADDGNADAMYSLSWLYSQGYGVTQNSAQAREWYQKAAKGSNASAEQRLSVIGRSSVTQPLGSVTSSAAESLAQAKRYLGTKDFGNALPLLQKAAEGGNAEAMYNLGELYYQGWGVARDYDKARAWYQAAADGGNADAMYSLGWLYSQGYGVTQNSAQARKWYQKAASDGNTDAKQALEHLRRK